jgi:hypothetical protein
VTESAETWAAPQRARSTRATATNIRMGDMSDRGVQAVCPRAAREVRAEATR